MGDCANTGDRRSATRVPARAKPTPEAAAVHAVGFICRRTGSSLARSAPPLGDLDGGRASGCAKVAWRAFEGKHFTPSRGSACGEVMQDCLGQRGPWGDAPLRTAAPSRKRHSGGIALVGARCGRRACAGCRNGSGRRTARSARSGREPSRTGAETRTSSRAMLRSRMLQAGMQRGVRRRREVLLATARSVFGRLARGELFAIEQVGPLVQPSFRRQLFTSTKPVGRKLRKGC